LENNGLKPSQLSRPRVHSRESFEIKGGVIRYTDRSGEVFRYDAGIDLTLGAGEPSFKVRVEVDTSALKDGTVELRVYSPVVKLIPKDIVNRLEFKLHTLANLQVQRDMLAYFDRISKEQDRKRGLDGMLEAIALEAYNGSGPAASGRDRGGAEPLSDQVMLLGTLAIWLIGFPVFLFIVRTRRKNQRPA
jgi:hypothetical protein